MLFNSIEFLIFFPIVVCLYYLIPIKYRYIWLLISSYFFYMSWNPKYAILLLFSTAITYVSGLLLERFGESSFSSRNIEKGIVAVSFVLNVGILSFFKYFDFAFENVRWFFSRINIYLESPSFDIILPVGISFYTFQALSYTMDVYRKEIKAEKNFAKYALFVSFFPQLVAGPIERSKNLLHQINEDHYFDYYRFRKGLLFILYGLFQKLVIADRAAILVNQVYGEYQKYAGFELVVATVLFGFQIYCDFAGYSNIAIGTAKILGFELMENFNAPYLSGSVSEFWRRWHISLSTWFRDYLYIPLGGNRCSKIRKNFNLMVTFLVSGLWHGASWSFVLWGGINGFYQVISEWLGPARKWIITKFHIDENYMIIRVMRTIITFILIDFSWIFFRSDHLAMAIGIIRKIFSEFNVWIFFDESIYTLGLDRKEFAVLVFSLLLIFIYDLFKYLKISIFDWLTRQQIVIRWFAYYTLIFTIIIFGTYGQTYDVQNFIYFQF